MPWPRTTAGLILELAGHTPPTPQPQGRPPFVAVRPCSEIAEITPLVLIAGESNQECHGLNSRESEERCDPLPRESSRANEVAMEQVERCELGAIEAWIEGPALADCNYRRF